MTSLALFMAFHPIVKELIQDAFHISRGVVNIEFIKSSQPEMLYTFPKE